MFKALVRTVVLVIIVLVAAQFVPIVAQHEVALLMLVVAIGLFGIIARVLLILLALAAVLVWFHPFF